MRNVLVLDDGETYWSVNKISKRWGVTTRSVYSWIEADKMPKGIRIGRRWFFRKDELESRLIRE